MDEEHSGDDKRGNTSFFNDGEYDKTCNEGSTPQSGHICIFWAAKKGTSQKCDIFPRHAKTKDCIRYAKKATTPRKCVKIIMSWLNAGVSGTQSMR